MCAPEVAEVVRRRVEQEGLPRLDRRKLLAAGAGTALAAALPTRLARAANVPANRRADLTHVFREGFPTFNPPTPTRATIADFAVQGFYAQSWSFGEHSGTHMDAPGHFVPGGRLAPAITLEELIAPAVVIDISARAATNPDAVVTLDDVRSFERGHGRIPRGALVFMDSGWSAKAGDPLAFKGGASFPSYHFPGFGADAVRWLLEERAVTGIGVDTMSLDPGNSTTFPVHVMLLGANRYGLENVANLSSIPPRGATVFVGVIPWQAGSGGPARVIAAW